MPEIRPQFGRELKADDLKVGITVVVMQPYHPGYRVMHIVELTETTVRLIGATLHKQGHRPAFAMLCRLRSDGYFEDWDGTIFHVFKYLESPNQPRPIMPPFLPADSLQIGGKLSADELLPNTEVVLHTPETDTYCTLQVAEVGERTVDLLFTVEVPVRVTFSVQPDKTLRDPIGRTVEVFEYFGQP